MKDLVLLMHIWQWQWDFDINQEIVFIMKNA
jgi:hypothetical protein